MSILIVAATSSKFSNVYVISTKHNEFTPSFCVSYPKAKVQ
ncbi:hypothetical protein PCARR_a2667 [Pseudoalteromonas carrageenovora IAM 12662]|uniref:Uncharacterized protein n=1 Tax=Pseudoalteromonas carrageenovora IAM 12662 TaxID=1314868 RepID=A0ABR9EK68_PSEVC|nr:hypothetical protein [Pseudoalteromonas carrageenovora IAM 12662]